MKNLTLYEWIVSIICAIIVAFLLSFYMQKVYVIQEFELHQRKMQKTHLQKMQNLRK